MSYHQITPEERYTLALLRRQDPRHSCASLARILGRHRSTIWREFKRNSARLDGAYRHQKAQERTNGRRSRSRRKSHFSPEDWRRVEACLRRDFSPEQVSGRLRALGLLNISHETIYRYILTDKQRGGSLYLRLRCRAKQRRKRYGATDRRGRLVGKRHISERPPGAETRSELGHWEMDTVMGAATKDCVATLVERVTGKTMIIKLADRTVASLNAMIIRLLRRHKGRFRTITVDNGTEFHGYESIERATGVVFYFATPYHSWERGTNENTNGLLRQYLPKRQSMKGLTQRRCNAIANRLNSRPRKRLGYKTPLERFAELTGR